MDGQLQGDQAHLLVDMTEGTSPTGLVALPLLLHFITSPERLQGPETVSCNCCPCR